MIGDSLATASTFLLQGEIVAVPTETVYGLAGNALDERAIAKIFEAKNRPFFDPLIVHTYSMEEAKKYVKHFPVWAERLAKSFWPGPLTLLLPRSSAIPDLVTNGSDLVGIRIPNHPVTLALLQQLPFPLAAPSANPFGYISPTTAQHVADQLEEKVAYILDGGSSQVGVESTIVGIRNYEPAIYRAGGIAIEAIEETLGKRLTILPSSSNPKAPGMLESHYAPGKPLYVGDLASLAHGFKGKKIGVVSFYSSFGIAADKSIILSPAQDLNEAACRLFAALREMDHSDVEVIITEVFPSNGLGVAINDRLARAASKR